MPKRSEPNSIVSLVIGMAGSGKTTLMQNLAMNAPTYGQRKPYTLNLDPAVLNLSYTPNIDIRQTVKYKEVMKEYNLGPNGGILTALNLFATRFDQVLSLLEKRRTTIEHVFVDTPGQIEVFTWSASGMIITESLAQSFPTCLLYVVDTTRNLAPSTFVSNMLYACSIMYKTQLPFVMVLNKIDVTSSDSLIQWMTDYDSIEQAINDECQQNDSYSLSLTRSMALMLNEFYSTISVVSVSAATGEGFNTLYAAIDKCRDEYYNEYQPSLVQRLQQRQQQDQAEKQQSMNKLMKDLNASKGQKAVLTNEKPAVASNGSDANFDDTVVSDGEEAAGYDDPTEAAAERAEYEEFMQKLSITEQLEQKRTARAAKQSEAKR